MLETESELGHRSNPRGVAAVPRTKSRSGSYVVERRDCELRQSLVAAPHLVMLDLRSERQRV